MALRLQMVDPQLKCDLGACLGMVRVKYGSGKTRSDTISKVCEERVGLKHKAATHSTTSERYEKGTVAMIDQDEGTCVICHCGKGGKLAVRDLVRAKNKVQNFSTLTAFKICNNSNPQIIFFYHKMPKNPFPKAQDLLRKSYKAGAHLSHVEKMHEELCVSKRTQLVD